MPAALRGQLNSAGVCYLIARQGPLDSSKASLYFPFMRRRRKAEKSREERSPSRSGSRKTSLAQQAKATLRRVQFSSGICLGAFELSPQLTRAQQRALEYWILRLPAPLLARFVRLKITAAEHLAVVRENLFIGSVPGPAQLLRSTHTHAASFIPERYIVLDQALFRRRVETGRIFYHELCHFLWPRLGNATRHYFEAEIREEFSQGIRGELGYSAAWRKEKLQRESDGSMKSRSRRWREYVCESFCDTGAYVLLGRERRPRHSEYTLPRSARERRSALWSALLLRS